jgi:A/G-specific adenine glycosylase
MVRSTVRDTRFRAAVWDFYTLHGRHTLPWRQTTDPYHIVVSEMMLQQTQVARVIPKYVQFLKLFPTVRRLADAPLGEVLTAWQGLGYNRRAKFLKQTAEIIVYENNGVWPVTFEALRTLPGIGTYTAGAIMNFSYNTLVPLIETNIRTVYLHHFFKHATAVTDDAIMVHVKRTCDTHAPREWHWALMDYGAHLKMTVGNTNRTKKCPV